MLCLFFKCQMIWHTSQIPPTRRWLHSFFLITNILDIEIFVLYYFMEKEKKKNYAINCNCLFVGDYDYIVFQYNYTGIILWRIPITMQVKIWDNDYFVNKIYDYDCDYYYSAFLVNSEYAKSDAHLRILIPEKIIVNGSDRHSFLMIGCRHW